MPLILADTRMTNQRDLMQMDQLLVNRGTMRNHEVDTGITKRTITMATVGMVHYENTDMMKGIIMVENIHNMKLQLVFRYG